MRLVRFIDKDAQVKLGKDLGDDQAELLGSDPLAVFPSRPEPTGEVVAIVERLSPVQPSNIFCIGMNYKAHVAEMGGQLPERPVVFMKPTTTVQHPGQPVKIPKCEHDGPETDQEAELAVVIGKKACGVSVEDALDYVYGYTCANDVSARWWQKHGSGGQFIRGKGFDTFCPLGPVLVTHGEGEDEIGDPQNLRITGSLDGEVLQDGNTSDMIFSIAELVAFLSQDTTLLPGTAILTGTPPGVGWAREPKRLVRPGMASVIEIEGIGKLVNPVV
ncbi:MAG: fumarylacetoacetate hydrolase family protein [Phycisphaeraceae bacterium]|nr:fumarylacetoacetate hydrolase family protein [Phycisphaeraceae bacterium]